MTLHMETTMPTDAPLTKVLDVRYPFRGMWDQAPEAVCRVRILQRDGQPPILVLTELNENPSTSVTNVIEQLVAELVARYLPERFEVVDEEPVIVVEHYEATADPTRRIRVKPSYDRVTFANWRPRRTWLGGRERREIGTPDWRHLPAEEVRALLGDEADDL